MTDRTERATIGGITILAVVCRLAALFQPMRFDEAVSWAYYVGRPWATITGTYQQPNNHVFYSLLAKLSAAAFDYPPWALRLPAFVAGVAIVPLLWLVGRRFTTATLGLLAAALAAGSTQLVLYSTNARGYSLVVALFLAMLLVADELRVRPGAGRWAAFVVMGAVGLYTIPVMLYPLGIVGVWMMLAAWRMEVVARRLFAVKVIAAFAAMGIIAFALYLPIVRSAGIGAMTGNKFVTPSPMGEFVRELPHMIASTLASWTSPLPLLFMPVVAILAVLGFARTREAADARPSLALAAVLWCGLLLLATHRAPFVRVWLFMLPLFLLAVARGGERLLARSQRARAIELKWLPLGLAAGMSLLAMLTRAAERSDDTGTFRPAKEVTALLAPKLRAGDRVLAPIPSIGPLLYYFPFAGADTSLLTVDKSRATRAFLVLDTPHGQTVAWAVAGGVIDPALFAEPTLLARYPEGEVWESVRR